MNLYSVYSPDRIRKAMLESYGWMAGGLVITFAVSALLYSSGTFLNLLINMPALSLILALVQIVLTIAISAGLYRMRESTMKALYILYAATMGISLTSLAYVYDLGTIALAFLVSAVYFLCMVAVGLTTKRDMTKIGTICFCALLALVITQLVMLIFRVPMMMRLIAILGLIVFTGLTIWDIQRLPALLAQTEGTMMEGKMAIFMALELYLDFINIFLYILRLLGSRSSNN
ncbi:Bax inhibitor-1/YccA family protein [uncultured Faecalibaculum sp.]|uniref:Bax inhibitor-1/YccA family protein n=1 Tax=uncultured Faecalibaculum sp. TaxID=1729681 RepID=UPI0025FE6415|nr:Bax inhibitor-1/YccA family protein [uncultured Faecalibaculum sp.]